MSEMKDQSVNILHTNGHTFCIHVDLMRRTCKNKSAGYKVITHAFASQTGNNSICLMGSQILKQLRCIFL